MLKTLFSYFDEHSVQYKHLAKFIIGCGTYTALSEGCHDCQRED